MRNTIIRQRTRVTDIVQCVTNTKWKWARQIVRMKDDTCTIRSTVADKELKDQNVVGEMNYGATGSGIDKDSKGQRIYGDSGGGLLTAVEEHSLE